MSGGGNKAANEANRQEQARQRAIAGSQRRINDVFDSPGREADINDFMAALRERSLSDLDRQKLDTDRELRFALARGGLIGGTVQRDQQRRLGDDYARNLLKLERGVQGAGSELRAADQDARARLIGLATQGLDATTGARQAAESMRNNLQSASSTNLVNDIGNAFSGWSNFFTDARDAAARRRADQQAFGLYGGMAGGGYGS